MKPAAILTMAALAALLASPAFACRPIPPEPSPPRLADGATAEEQAASDEAWLAAQAVARAEKAQASAPNEQKVLFGSIVESRTLALLRAE